MQSIHPRIAANALQHGVARDRFGNPALVALDGKTQLFSITYLMHVDPSLMLLRAPPPINLDVDDRYGQYPQLPL